ncbi:hypothetical protein FQN53_004461 [Emmonsiellopsis sp. PD_33]|nr:hypothetical protein FQN53_004461 [Emmonsiellopsis sp. PD_33]
MPVHPSLAGSTFDTDIRNRHLVYEYIVQKAETATTTTERWKYEFWIQNEDRIVYTIHGGPMAGRKNFQATTWQCIRPHELWQCNWLEETGTIVSLVYDIPNGKITTLIAFSKGHWERNEEAKGDKRNQEDMERWRGLARVGGSQTDRVMLSEQAVVLENYWGRGDLEEVEMGWPTL